MTAGQETSPPVRRDLKKVACPYCGKMDFPGFLQAVHIPQGHPEAEQATLKSVEIAPGISVDPETPVRDGPRYFSPDGMLEAPAPPREDAVPRRGFFVVECDRCGMRRSRRRGWPSWRFEEIRGPTRPPSCGRGKHSWIPLTKLKSANADGALDRNREDATR